MQPHAALAALILLALHSCAAALKLTSLVPPAAKDNMTAKAAVATPAKADKLATVADVAKLRKKLQAVALGLEGVVSKEGDGGLATSKLAPALRSFLKELNATLTATASPKNPSAAMEKLRAAQAGMADLTKALTTQQSDLMHESEDQAMSLLLGVLMTKRGEPFEKQLEVLASPDFSSLPVSKELRATKDQKTPLFQQVANYMDKHGQDSKVALANREDRLAKSVQYFSKRVEVLKSWGERMEKVHSRTMNELHKSFRKFTSKDTKHHYQLMMRNEDHEYKKRMAVNTKQVKMMENVVAALKRGDVGALKTAEDTLKASMKAMQQRTGGFLHLLQLGHRLSQTDCPYCAAQCIEKCHNDGTPYTQCLTTCADAGK